MIRNIFYILLLLFMIVGCSNKEEFILFNQVDLNQSQEKSIETSQFDNIQFEYKIVPHDRVSIIVYRHPEFSSSSLETRAQDRGILVNSKGDIRLPLVKSIHIAGLTQTQALEKIESAFKRYLKSPDIYLEVLNKRAYVVGEVKTPGEIELVIVNTGMCRGVSLTTFLRSIISREVCADHCPVSPILSGPGPSLPELPTKNRSIRIDQSTLTVAPVLPVDSGISEAIHKLGRAIAVAFSVLPLPDIGPILPGPDAVAMSLTLPEVAAIVHDITIKDRDLLSLAMLLTRFPGAGVGVARL